MKRSRINTFLRGCVFLACYAGVLGLGAALGAGVFSQESSPAELAIGRVLGLLAGFIIVLQFTLSGRLKILDRVFGFDRLMRFHAIMGPSAIVLVLLHPLFVLSGEQKGLGALAPEHWPIILGAVGGVLLAVVVVTTLGRKFLELRFESWLGLHRLAFIIVVIVVVHAIALGAGSSSLAGIVTWAGLVVLYAGVFVWAKLIKPLLLKKNRFIITHVDQVSHNTWNLRLKPKFGEMFEHLPGQFAFLTLYRKTGQVEQHPFTISSAANGEYLEFTIKQSGDYTSTIGQTTPGDTAAIDGPYGRFSYLRLPATERLILIAGGVGITPLLSCLRHIEHTGQEKPITLIWANRTRDDIFFRGELNEMLQRIPDFKVVHILSDQEDYDGYKGRVNEGFLKEVLPPDIKKSIVMLCGPPPMMKSVTGILKKIGFKKRQIKTEKFSL